MIDGKMAGKLDDREFAQAIAQLIREKKVVIFPSEAIYVIGFDYFDEQSRERVYDLKSRPKEKRFPAFIASEAQLERVGVVPNALEQRFMDKYWPSSLVIAFSETFMAKMPSSKVLRDAIAHSGTILGVTSANKSGHLEVTKASNLDKEMVEKVDALFVEDERLTGGAATFVRLKGKVEILRQGSIDVSEDMV